MPQYFLLTLITMLSSCASDFKQINSADDPDFWGAEQSEIWIAGERKEIYTLIARHVESPLGKLTGKGGGIIIRYVLDPPPPWTRNQTNRLIKNAKAWQHPQWATYPEQGLDSISQAMGIPSSRRRYLVSINPLVIATTQEPPPQWDDDYRVHLIDLTLKQPALKIYILAGEYPATADLWSGSRDGTGFDDRVQIKARTRILKTGTFTLNQILDTPQLWQSLEP